MAEKAAFIKQLLLSEMNNKHTNTCFLISTTCIYKHLLGWYAWTVLSLTSKH